MLIHRSEDRVSKQAFKKYITEQSLLLKNYRQAKSQRYQKFYRASTKQNKADVAIILADKLEFKVKIKNSDRRKIHQQVLVIMNLYALTNLN